MEDSSEGEIYQLREPSYESDDDSYVDIEGVDEDEHKRKRYDDDEDEGSFLSLRKHKTPKLDRISGLPDSIIHHILSFLPTSEDAVRTGVLSRRWECLWTSVPNLIFRYRKSSNNNNDGNIQDFFNFIEKTLILYSSPKIKKFVLDFGYHIPDYSLDSRIRLWVRFALRHDVDELCLQFCEDENEEEVCYPLPQFFYNNSKLLKLKSKRCDYTPKGKVYWNSLKTLSISYTEFSDDAVNKILQGTPVLEFFKLHQCSGIGNLDITSKSLNKLVINGICDAEDVVSVIEISAPNLLSLEILGNWYCRKCRLMNVSSLLSVTLNFELTVDKEEESNDFYSEYRNMLKELLDKLHRVKELTLGTWCIQVLSISEVKVLPSPMSNRKCLILGMCFDEWDLPGLASLLRSSPNLEKLVIDMTSHVHRKFDMHPKLYNSYHFGENYWTSKKLIFKYSLLHLKTIEIVGPKARSCGSERLFAFLKFLLGNAKMLEKMVITDKYDRAQRKHDLYEVAKKLLSFPRSSPHAVILLPK